MSGGAEPDPVAILSAADRLSLWIGRVSQADVHLERSLRNLWVHLSGPGLSVALVPLSFDRLLQDCRTMLTLADPAERVLAAGLGVLAAADVAHKERNRVIHDMWLLDVNASGEVEGEAFIRHRIVPRSPFEKATRRTLSDVEAAHDALVRTNYRAHFVSFVVPPYWRPSAGTRTTPNGCCGSSRTASM